MTLNSKVNEAQLRPASWAITTAVNYDTLDECRLYPFTCQETKLVKAFQYCTTVER